MKKYRELRLKKICEAVYYQPQQMLNLEHQGGDWPDVLSARNWSMIKVLKLNSCELTDEDLDDVLKFPWLEVTDLDLYVNDLTQEGMKKLVKKDWPKLQQISLTSNLIEDQGLQLLLEKFKDQLTKIWLSGCGLTNIGMQKMLKYTPKNVKQLYLSANYIGSSGVKFLIKSDFPTLQKLQISDCWIGNEGYKHLSKGKWVNLNQLWIQAKQNGGKSGLGLNGWQMNNQTWNKLKTILCSQNQWICLLYFVIISSIKAKIIRYIMKVTNGRLEKSIANIFYQRNLFDS